MEKIIYQHINLTTETDQEITAQSARLGWLTRGAASDFHFAQKQSEWLGVRRSHTMHRREGLNISRHENGNYRITITLPPHILAADLVEELHTKAALAAIYFEGKEAAL